MCAHEVNVSTSAGGGEGDHGRPQVDEDAGFRSADAVAGTGGFYDSFQGRSG